MAQPKLKVILACIICLTQLSNSAAASIFQDDEIASINLHYRSLDGTCQDNIAYIDQQFQMGCENVQSDESMRQELCVVGDFRTSCPFTCGDCCDDDSTFSYQRSTGDFIDCAWIGRDDIRIPSHCNDEKGGEAISKACPKTCNKCFTNVTSAPSDRPSTSLNPTSQPSQEPTLDPTTTSIPTTTASPSSLPSEVPSLDPTSSPTSNPTSSPSSVPTPSPSSLPSEIPSSDPTSSPTSNPTSSPSSVPTPLPSSLPSEIPSSDPTSSPTSDPTSSPSSVPTSNPTSSPSKNPSSSPSSLPTDSPTSQPTSQPSSSPIATPSSSPSSSPTSAPSVSPTNSPTKSPTESPTKSPTSSPTETRPNLVMILTDEHNMRTLSCYRDYLLSKYSKEKVDVWGDISLYTPNIDRLANEGALYTNFYTVAPLCTPSRASFVTGLYPQFTGDSKMNHGKMDLGLTTWAEILSADKGYHTGYMGKWHLDGPEKPLWGSNNRDFGFEDNKYRYNRGHWKYFSEINGEPMGYEMEGESLFPNAYKEHYATDFLMDRGIEFIESAVDNNDPFALVLSIPDPHGPNENRPYYRNLFDNIEFRIPETARKNWKFNPAPGGFNSYGQGEGPPVDDVDNWIDEYENAGFWQRHMQQYYGMVKCIDYNIGRLLQTLSDKGIDDNTIIVFTSDHGDQLMEHGKLNKGRPYETSAGIPFLVRYPGTVPAGKVIETAHSSIDFAPTILSLMGVDYSPDVGFQGVDGSEELTDSRAVSNNENQIVFSFDTGNKPTWAAAIKGGYKLIFQKSGIPWFFDLRLDPEEMTNYIDSSMHAGIVEELRLALVQAIKDYNAPLLEVTNTIYLAKPKCYDSKNILPLNNGRIAFCKDLGNTLNISKCNNQQKVRTACPFKCGACECEDTPGLIFVDGSARSCDTLQNVCHEEKVRRFCPATCNTCTNS